MQQGVNKYIRTLLLPELACLACMLWPWTQSTKRRYFGYRKRSQRCTWGAGNRHEHKPRQDVVRQGFCVTRRAGTAASTRGGPTLLLLPTFMLSAAICSAGKTTSCLTPSGLKEVRPHIATVRFVGYPDQNFNNTSSKHAREYAR